MKKINSEKKIDNELFNVIIGTTDKKNPEVIYFEIWLYITPTTKQNTYVNQIEKIEKTIKNNLHEIIDNSDLCKQDFIMVQETAVDRIIDGKKSYIGFQIFVKPKNISKYKKFSEVTDKFTNEFLVKVIPMIKDNIVNNGFKCYKKRK